MHNDVEWCDKVILELIPVLVARAQQDDVHPLTLMSVMAGMASAFAGFMGRDPEERVSLLSPMEILSKENNRMARETYST